ncbi:FkbM family methyltransferase [Longimicrobium sp.]|uniref:FkbM family methyltransferase n=1 Tax=Longimicrobium sp. TaxID=2029185 RepID=UPI002E3783D1|nr:FkbM family methyltransferase [Longimicrobium sp.]HEX6037883.1 FkbM family methyltransferase [Longimicrobium sp.]
MKRILRRLLNRAGIDVVRHDPVPHHLARRAHLLRRFAPDVVLDVGANAGLYGREVRQVGYGGRLVSFEPMAAAYAALSAQAARDPAWTAVNVALGAAPGDAVLNVAANSWSSSLRPMLDTHLHAAPDSAYMGRETVHVETLDAVFDRYARPGDGVWLKIDTQGHERDVLAGAADSLARIDMVELEMSPVGLYEGEALFTEMFDWLVARGFACVHLQPGLYDPADERLLSVDGYFRRVRPA